MAADRLAATRVVRAPFTPHPEEFDAAGLLTKSVELVTLALLGMLLGRLAQPSRPKYARIIARAAALGILTGGLMLFAGYALEPALPSLAAAGASGSRFERPPGTTRAANRIRRPSACGSAVSASARTWLTPLPALPKSATCS
jgi:cytochrome c biogenesis protein CcdA